MGICRSVDPKDLRPVDGQATLQRPSDKESSSRFAWLTYIKSKVRINADRRGTLTSAATIMRKYVVFALAMSLVVGAIAAYVGYNDTVYVNKQFRAENQKLARRIYEIQAWHAAELPQFRSLPPSQLVAALLSEYSSVYQLENLIEDAEKNRQPSPTLSKPVELDSEDLIRIDPDLPGPTEYEKLNRAEQEYWAAVQRLRPVVWAFQRQPLRVAAVAAAKFAAGSFLSLLLAAGLFIFMLRPLLAILWRLAMRGINDISNAIRGKYGAT